MIPFKTIIEGLLFVSTEPLTAEKLKEAFAEEDNVSLESIKKILNQLLNEYENRNGGFVLKEIALGYQFRTRPELSSYILRVKKTSPARLSKAALETLAIVAYRQPILKVEIEKIRGVDVTALLKNLMERDLIAIKGRKNNLPGKPIIYGTGKKFLETFDLPSLEALPTLEEIKTLVDNENKRLF